jgi:hypothetical protein
MCSTHRDRFLGFKVLKIQFLGINFGVERNPEDQGINPWSGDYPNVRPSHNILRLAA